MSTNDFTSSSSEIISNTNEFKHKYQRPNQNDYEDLLREERKLTKQMQNILDRISQKKDFIAKKYRLVETEEKTKKRQAVKREREHFRLVQLENLRVDRYKLEEQQVTLRYKLKDTRERLRKIARAMKYYARFDKKVVEESHRADLNKELFIKRAVKQFKVKQPTKFTVASFDSEEAAKPILVKLFEITPAVFEVIMRRVGLKQEFLRKLLSESSAVVPATDTRQSS